MHADPSPATDPAPAPVRSSPWPISGWTGIGDAVVLAVGTFLPWVEVTAGPLSITRSGLDTGDGKVMLFLAIMGAAFAVLGIVLKRLLPCYLLLAIGLIAIVVSAYDISDVQTTGDDLGLGDLIQADAGIGLWICLVGGIGMATSGVLAFVLDRPRAPR